MLTDTPITDLIKQLQASADIVTLNINPSRDDRQYHREVINELVYRLYTFLGD